MGPCCRTNVQTNKIHEGLMKKILVPVILGSIVLGIVFVNIQRYWDSDHLKLSGTLELTEHSVGAHVPGRLELMKVDEGDSVQKNQLIATLDRYEQAQRDLGRVKQLFKNGGATQQAL